MRQLSQNYKTGMIRIETVAPPAVKRGGILVRSAFSVVSPGTEGMKVREGRMNYLEKALARPDQVKKVLESARQQGLAATFQKVSNKLDSLTPLGYAVSGVVEAVGPDCPGFHVGQRVACAGAGLANHAEINFVPRNLCVPVPDGVPMEAAAFATMGAIAMHALRQGDLRLGETACVIGLGLVGQLLIQLLRAAGVSVIGIDPDAERCRLAVSQGAVHAADPTDAAICSALLGLTGCIGADCVFLAAATPTNAPLEQAIDLVRDRGRIVAVGKTRLDLPYVDSFRKEVEVRFSRSYGPGRYDPSYEERGNDYPVGYVRWTEGRNLSAFLDLVARRAVDPMALVGSVTDFADAVTVYDALHEGRLPGLCALFRYGPGSGTADPTLVPAGAPGANSGAKADGAKANVAGEARRPGTIGIAAIGAGNYAASMLFPVLRTLPEARLRAVVTTTPLSSADAARKFGFASHGSNVAAALDDPGVDAVLIATRHASHADLAVRALQAGRAVFVEKPLAVDADGLSRVDAATATNDRLMVGFNRRFSPSLVTLKRRFTAGTGPLTLLYRVHAGPLPGDAWQRHSDEGGRFIGEAGHFFDCFAFLTGSTPVAVTAAALRGRNAGDNDDNLSVTVEYADGSMATLLYLTQGGLKVPKEHLEVFGQGRTAVMDNFDSVTVFDGDRRPDRIRTGGGKGQGAMLTAFIQACREGGPMPIDLTGLIRTSRLTLAAAESARQRRTILLD